MSAARTVSVASPRRSRARILANIALAVIGISFVIPIAWIVFSAFNDHATVSISLPDRPTFANFTSIFTVSQTLLPLWNSFVISFGAAALTIVLGVLAAYPLSRFNLRFQRGFLYGILFGSCLPITAMMVPSTPSSCRSSSWIRRSA